MSFLAVVCVAFPVHGGVISTSNGTLNLKDPGAPGSSAGPPLLGVASISLASDGFGFVNQLDAGAPAVGKTVISATLTQLASATGVPVGLGSPNFNPVVLANGNVGGLITVLKGKITSVATGPTIKFDSVLHTSSTSVLVLIRLVKQPLGRL